MRIGEFEFNRRELAGAMGDFGTLLPLAAGYIAVCGLDPAGFLVVMGVVNVALGLIYRLPMPLEPKKVVAAVAIAEAWSPPLIYTTGFSLGLLWLALAVGGLVERVVRWIPPAVVRGIQLALGITLVLASLRMMSTWWIMGLIAVVVALVLRDNRHLPGAIALVLLGLGVIVWRGQAGEVFRFGFRLPPLTLPQLDLIVPGMLGAGLGQIPLTLTNATIATVALIRDYFPEKGVSERKLLLNQGVMNVAGAFFGGMPMCHGAQGLAGQYMFGARTGGASILEGLIEIGMGLFLANSLLGLFRAFPQAILGAMMLLVAWQLLRPVAWLRGKEMGFAILTGVLGSVVDMAIAALVGVVGYHLWERFFGHEPKEDDVET
jgi:MFS superfamily sulfate permease-like transporter